MKRQEPLSTATGTPSHWMDKYGIEFKDRLTASKAQLEANNRYSYPLNRRLYSILVLGAAGYQSEVAHSMRNGIKVEMQHTDIRGALHKADVKHFREAGYPLTKEHLAKLYTDKDRIRRALAEIEEDGLCERRCNGVPLREMSEKDRQARLNGKIQIYVWLRPRNANPEAIRQDWEAFNSDSNQVGKKSLPEYSIDQRIKDLHFENSDLSKFFRHCLSDPSLREIVTQAWEEDARKKVEEARESFVQGVFKRLPEGVLKKLPQGVAAVLPFNEVIEEEINEEKPPAPQAPRKTTGRAQQPDEAGRQSNIFELQIRSYFPSASAQIIQEIRQAADQAYGEPLPDEVLAKAVAAAYFPKQQAPQAFLTTVPRVIQSWIEELRHEQTA